jgi:hypothetical protein
MRQWTTVSYATYAEAVAAILGTQRFPNSTTTDVDGITVTDAVVDFIAAGVTAGDILVNVTQNWWDVVTTVAVHTVDLTRVTRTVIGDTYTIFAPGVSTALPWKIEPNPHTGTGTTYDLSFCQDPGYLDGADLEVDSNDEPSRWLDVTNPGNPPDANGGAILVATIAAGIVAPTPAKLYELPPHKEFHSISLASQDSDGNNYQYTIQVFGVNSLPTAAWTITDWSSVGVLLVPSFTIARDQSLVLISQPLIRCRDQYLLFVVDTGVVAPATNPMLRIRSYNPGDKVI